MKLNSIYTTFNGEVNAQGIGSPVIFVRLQGCHLRCYKKTMGILCDTPEGLKKPTQRDEINSIFAEIEQVSKTTGLKLITLTGGDPLWNKEEELIELFTLLSKGGYTTNVETSGTISWLPYRHIPRVHWVLDYKCKSTGVSPKLNLLAFRDNLLELDKNDFIKFVIYDGADYEEFLSFFKFKELVTNCQANIAVGAFWGGKLDTFELFEMLKKDGLLSKITINMQTHKMAVSSDYNKFIPTDI